MVVIHDIDDVLALGGVGAGFSTAATHNTAQ